MSIDRILLAVDGSPAGLEAARVAVDLARRVGGRMRAVTVCTEELARDAEAILAHVRRLAHDAGVAVETERVADPPARTILDQATGWEAGCIVIGRSDRHGPGSSYIGSVTAHVVEFSECPVIVVPVPSER
ncbi:MAG: universal stress protein [Actinomycetota bacterium]